MWPAFKPQEKPQAIGDVEMTKGQRALRDAIRNRGMTMIEAANLLDINPRQFRRYYNGHMLPDLYWASRIEAEFGVGYQLWVDDRTYVSVTPTDDS